MADLRRWANRGLRRRGPGAVVDRETPAPRRLPAAVAACRLRRTRAADLRRPHEDRAQGRSAGPPGRRLDRAASPCEAPAMHRWGRVDHGRDRRRLVRQARRALRARGGEGVRVERQRRRPPGVRRGRRIVDRPPDGAVPGAPAPGRLRGRVPDRRGRPVRVRLARGIRARTSVADVRGSRVRRVRGGGTTWERTVGGGAPPTTAAVIGRSVSTIVPYVVLLLHIA